MPVWGWVCAGLAVTAGVAAAAVAAALVRSSRRRDRLLRQGQTVVAWIVGAHPCLYDANDRSTFSAAFVVFTLDGDDSEEHLEELAEVAGRLEGFRPKRGGGADEREIARALSRQTTVGETPLRLPDRVTGGREVYFATPNVMRRLLPEGRLTRPYLYLKVLVSGEDRDLAMIDYPEE